MGMFESLTDKLSGVFARITSRGVLNDKDIDEAMREIRVALLEADVALPVVKDFVARVKEEARGEKLVRSIQPGQLVVKIVHDELVKLLLSDRPRAGIEALVDSGLADIVLPEIPALQLEIDEHHRHKDVFEHTMIVIERAVALETGSDGPVPAPDLTLRLALHDIGKPKTRRFEAGGKVSFHRHDAVGAKMTRKRLKALHFDHHMVEDVSELVNLHLRFHGYVEEPWTDSAVRRYVKDAGPLYERLNRLTRADTTTQNKRKAMMFSAAMDEMEQRVRDLKEKEDFDAIRPDLNGDEIMQLLSIEPGPMVGKAYKHMLEYRLDNGPVERDVAVAELERWYKEQGE